jgi:hypothetical protein
MMDYGKIIIEKLRKFRATGLFEEVDYINILVLGMRETDRNFFEQIKTISDKIKVFELQGNFNNECDSLNFIKKYFEDKPHNIPFLYLHTKGVTQIHPIIKKRVNLWTRYMDVWNIYNWKKCLLALKSSDTCGGLYISGKISHYQGNFWWANSNFIKTLPYITKENISSINRGEFWFSLNQNMVSCDVNDVVFPQGHDFYQSDYIKENYFPQGF